MACGCSEAKATPDVAQANFSPNATRHVFLAQGETLDCFMARAADGMSPVPDASDIVIDRITNPAIVANCERKVDMTFTLSEGSLTQVADQNDPKYPGSNFLSTPPPVWSATLKEVDDEFTPFVLTDTGLTFDTASGKLSGTVNDTFSGKKLRIEISISATNKDTSAVAEVDNRTYMLVAEKCDKDTLRLIRPLPIANGRITGKFDELRSSGSRHKGVDYAKQGEIGEIVAAADGVVTFAGETNPTGYATLIKISHRNAAGKELGETRYAHWSEKYVANGDVVHAGQRIALEGNRGHSSAPHLHFELRLNGKPVNPEDYMNGPIPVNPADVNSPTVNQTGRGLTANESAARGECPDSVPIGDDPHSGDIVPSSAGQRTQKHNCSPPTPPGLPSKEEVLQRVDAQIDKLGGDNADKDYFHKMIYIESVYDPYAYCDLPTSHALGLYQMLPSTGKEYFRKIGVPYSCENQCNIEYATQAQWKYYTKQKNIYLKFKNTGKVYSTLPKGAHGARYQNMDQQQFIYMLHHDGEGSVQNSNNLQGADIWSSRMKRYSN